MAYLFLVVGVSAVGISVVLWRHHARSPRTVDASIDRFARARSALAPRTRPRDAGPAPNPVRRDQRRRHELDPAPPRPARPVPPAGSSE